MASLTFERCGVLAQPSFSGRLAGVCAPKCAPALPRLQSWPMLEQGQHKLRLDASATEAAPAPTRDPNAGFGSNSPLRGNITPHSLPLSGLEESSAITTLHSREEFDTIVNKEQGLVVLMCKSRSCRPCKMFTRKYHRIADQFSGSTFLEIFGDETKDTRDMMVSMQVKVTPTFFLYRQGSLVKTVTGINDQTLKTAITGCLYANETGAETGAAGAAEFQPA